MVLDGSSDGILENRVLQQRPGLGRDGPLSPIRSDPIKPYYEAKPPLGRYRARAAQIIHRSAQIQPTSMERPINTTTPTSNMGHSIIQL